MLPLYLSLIAAQAGFVTYVVRLGLRRTGTPLAALIGGRWSTPRDVAVDVAAGIGLWLLWFAVAKAWDHVLGSGHAASIGAYLPRGGLESARIAAYGALFGLLAWWRGSLRPGMLAHAMTDVLAGLVRP